MKRFTAIFAAVAAAASFIAANVFNVSAQQQEPSVSAVSAVLINADTGGVIFEKNADEKRAVASTTKIMTALLTLEAGQPDRRFTVDSMAIRVEGTSMGLREGDIVTRRALCYGMLLPSGNDAANAAAVDISGSLSAFADKMNEKAAQLGMNDSHFVTPSGLDAPEHYSTARDMAKLTRAALENEDFRAICGLTSAALEFGNPPYSRTLYNSNKLLKQYDGCIGVKTGFTDNARRCLVSAAERDGVTLIAVTLNAPDDWNDHKKLLDYGFSLVKPREISLESVSVDIIGGTNQKVCAVPDGSATVGLTASEADEIRTEYRVPAFVYAEVFAGDCIGYVEIYYKEELLRSIPLRAETDCPRETAQQSLWERVRALFTG